MSKVGYKALVEAAEARIDVISAAEAIDRLNLDDVVFVDLRDVRELKRDGGIPGAFHCPRGLLEFCCVGVVCFVAERLAAEVHVRRHAQQHHVFF